MASSLSIDPSLTDDTAEALKKEKDSLASSSGSLNSSNPKAQTVVDKINGLQSEINQDYDNAISGLTDISEKTKALENKLTTKTRIELDNSDVNMPSISTTSSSNTTSKKTPLPNKKTTQERITNDNFDEIKEEVETLKGTTLTNSKTGNEITTGEELVEYMNEDSELQESFKQIAEIQRNKNKAIEEPDGVAFKESLQQILYQNDIIGKDISNEIFINNAEALPSSNSDNENGYWWADAGTVIISAIEGVASLGEAVIDTSIMLDRLKGEGIDLIKYLLFEEKDDGSWENWNKNQDELWKETMALVSEDYVKDAFDYFYYDTTIGSVFVDYSRNFDKAREVGNYLGEVGTYVAVDAVTFGYGGTALKAATDFSKNASYAYENGASINEMFLYTGAKTTVGAAEYYGSRWLNKFIPAGSGSLAKEVINGTVRVAGDATMAGVDYLANPVFENLFTHNEESLKALGFNPSDEVLAKYDGDIVEAFNDMTYSEKYKYFYEAQGGNEGLKSTVLTNGFFSLVSETIGVAKEAYDVSEALKTYDSYVDAGKSSTPQIGDMMEDYNKLNPKQKYYFQKEMVKDGIATGNASTADIMLNFDNTKTIWENLSSNEQIELFDLMDKNQQEQLLKSIGDSNAKKFANKAYKNQSSVATNNKSYSNEIVVDENLSNTKADVDTSKAFADSNVKAESTVQEVKKAVTDTDAPSVRADVDTSIKTVDSDIEVKGAAQDIKVDTDLPNTKTDVDTSKAFADSNVKAESTVQEVKKAVADTDAPSVRTDVDSSIKTVDSDVKVDADLPNTKADIDTSKAFADTDSKIRQYENSVADAEEAYLQIADDAIDDLGNIETSTSASKNRTLSYLDDGSNAGAVSEITDAIDDLDKKSKKVIEDLVGVTATTTSADSSYKEMTDVITDTRKELADTIDALEQKKINADKNSASAYGELIEAYKKIDDELVNLQNKIDFGKGSLDESVDSFGRDILGETDKGKISDIIESSKNANIDVVDNIITRIGSRELTADYVKEKYGIETSDDSLNKKIGFQFFAEKSDDIKSYSKKDGFSLDDKYLTADEASDMIERLDQTSSHVFSEKVNEIFIAYKNNSKLFEDTFGFPMYVEIDGKKALNSKQLLSELYDWTDNLLDSNVKNLTQSQEFAISRYLEKKGIISNFEGEKIMYFESEEELKKVIGDIQSNLENGYEVKLGLKSSKTNQQIATYYNLNLGNNNGTYGFKDAVTGEFVPNISNLDDDLSAIVVGVKEDGIIALVQGKKVFIDNESLLYNFAGVSTGKIDITSSIKFSENSASLKGEILETVDGIDDEVLKARKLYIELNKRLHYDVDYFKSGEVMKKRILEVNNNFSNIRNGDRVVCKGWSQLYEELLLESGFDKNSIRKCDVGGAHYWVEIDTSWGVIKADATDAVRGSADISNCKSDIKTGGFIAINDPNKVWGGVRPMLITRDTRYNGLIQASDDWLFKIDKALGYAGETGYAEKYLLEAKNLFGSSGNLSNMYDIDFFTKQIEALLDMEMPKNMDGFEAYAYYDLLRKNSMFFDPTNLTTYYLRTPNGVEGLSYIEFATDDIAQIYSSSYGKIRFNSVEEARNFVNGLDIIRKGEVYAE